MSATAMFGMDWTSLASFNPIFITYFSLIVMAVIPIYLGSKQSVEESEV